MKENDILRQAKEVLREGKIKRISNELFESAKQEIKSNKIDYEALEAIAEQISRKIEEEVDTRLFSEMWKVGKIISERVKDLRRIEVGIVYDILERKTDLDRNYLRKCKLFYERFPDLEERIKKTEVPIRIWWYLANSRYFYKIEEEDLKEAKMTSLEGFKRYLAGKYGKFEDREIICLACERAFRLSQANKLGKRGWVCFDCIEKIEEYDKLKAQNDFFRRKIWELRALGVKI